MASSSLPQSMPAIQIAKTGDPSVLALNTAPVPAVPEGHVLVRNAYAGINYIDTYFRTGLYPIPGNDFPYTLGREGAGTVAAAHPSVASKFPNGTRVVYMGSVGAYASYSAVPAALVVVIPDNLSLDAGEVKSGEWALVHAAAGGVGGLLVQMLKAVGARVIATASSDEKLAAAHAKGAEFGVNSKSANLVEEVKKITGGHGVDVVFDGVGKTTFDGDVEMAARKGRLVVFGNASGAVDPVNILRLGGKNLKLMRPVVNGYLAEREELERYGSELFEMLTSGKVEVPVYKTYPLADASQAHIDLESRKTSGKLLLKID
ncbi:quinone oxidoreductase [Verticillium dahliae VdLs.17]|uniref:Quinone oxidoreductase n=1 Tax=Verticillium dahliae (strain VdLs.17 / ATCC MYA-4575 / FGSC 10137) TaxID=498257 RepID=G2XCW1_VERDV|nr:quinone oxidoreductase [Verticillium dahliae VdLs.17]EGY16829.1 quinone oxidoreductase [Verticillium dahliae VdLs.17]KAH6706799.1 quinone oxidoreductase [Verticillium dahliae]